MKPRGFRFWRILLVAFVALFNDYLYCKYKVVRFALRDICAWCLIDTFFLSGTRYILLDTRNIILYTRYILLDTRSIILETRYILFDTLLLSIRYEMLANIKILVMANIQ
jgi:hypothetical protein